MFLEILMLIPRLDLILYFIDNLCRMRLWEFHSEHFFHGAFSMFFDYLSVVDTIFPHRPVIKHFFSFCLKHASILSASASSDFGVFANLMASWHRPNVWNSPCPFWTPWSSPGPQPAPRSWVSVGIPFSSGRPSVNVTWVKTCWHNVGSKCHGQNEKMKIPRNILKPYMNSLFLLRRKMPYLVIHAKNGPQ